MFIDHRRRLIFFHNPRCGGTTITRWAASLPHADSIDLIWAIPSPDGAPDLGHLTPRQAHGRVEATLLRHYNAFTIRRRPLPRLVSGFQELLNQPLGIRWLNRHSIGSLREFALHLGRHPEAVEDETIPWIRPQVAYLDPDLHGLQPGQLTILDFESLHQQLPAFLRRCGYGSWPGFTAPRPAAPLSAGQLRALEAALEVAYRRDLALITGAELPVHVGVSRPQPLRTEALPAAAAGGQIPMIVIHRRADRDRWRRISAQAQQRSLRLHVQEACSPEQLSPAALAHLADPCQAAVPEAALALAVLQSHLRALRTWLQGSGSAFALILEDDLDLAGLDAWGFTLEQLAEALPSNCGLLQLAVIWPLRLLSDGQGDRPGLPTPADLRLHRHRPGLEWSTAALLYRRAHAEALLAGLAPEPDAGLDPGAIGGPLVADGLLFDHQRFGSGYATYSAPLLTCHGFPATDASAAGPPARDAMGSAFSRSALQRWIHNASRDWIQAQLRQRQPLPLEAVCPSGQPVWLEAKEQPLVSLFTPTRNRARLLPLLERCLLAQTYPRCRLEWVIVDDSDAGEPRFLPQQDQGLRVRQLHLAPPLPIGAKRNLAADLCQGLIIVNCDDDDFYPPERVEHAVQALLSRPDHLVAGSSQLPIQFWDRDELWTSGPFAVGHATAGTLAYRRVMLERHRHDPSARRAEEQGFLAGFSLPMLQLDPWRTTVLMAHRGNTVDKSMMLRWPRETRMQRSDRRLAEMMPPDLLEAYARCLGPGAGGAVVS